MNDLILNKINELELQLISTAKSVEPLIENYVELNDIYSKISEHNDLIITEISMLLEEARDRCDDFKNGKYSIKYCFDECMSPLECYSEIHETINKYYNKYLDTEVIAEITLEALLNKNFTGIIDLKTSVFSECIVEFYSKENVKVLENLNSKARIYINPPINTIFQDTSCKIALCKFGSEKIILLPNTQNRRVKNASKLIK